MRIIITAGGTIEPIDSVRCITNLSTGKTGSVIAEYFSKKNSVTYLCSRNARFLPPINRNTKIKYFDTFNSLNNLLKKELGSKNYDIIIHCAAVSDYSIHSVHINGKTFKKINQKISSDVKFITIKLKRNFKILDKLKEYSKNKNISVIAFKLTSGNNKKEIKKAIEKLKADIVVHNDTSTIFKDKHMFNIYFKNNIIEKAENEKELAKKLIKLTKELI